MSSSQGLWAAFRSWRSRGRDSPVEPLKVGSTADTLVLDLWPAKLRDNTFLSLKVTRLWIMCYDGDR